MDKPVIVVAGLGRCGSSLTMQMLAAGGMPCIGGAPAYEDQRVAVNGLIDHEWFDTLGGHAVKVLDPHLNLIPSTSHRLRVIWLERRISQQAKSIIKMLQLLDDSPRVKSRQIRALEESLVRDGRQARSALAGLPLLTLQFEEILAAPKVSAARIAEFLAPAIELDIDKMAGKVRSRAPQCAPDMRMEIELSKEARNVRSNDV